MTGKQANKEQITQLDESTENELELDLVNILYKIFSIRKTLYKAAAIGLILGIIVALSIPKQYTVQVILSPEMGSSKGNNGLAGLAASFLGSGITSSEGSDALNVSLSADIISSTPFLLELLDIQISSSNKEENVSLSTYLNKLSVPWWNYIVSMPGNIISKMRSWFKRKNKEMVTNNIKRKTIELTKEENWKITFLKKNVTASVDKKTAMTSIVVTLQDPKVTAIVADSVVQKLQEYIINYRTSKAKEDCAYLEKLFKDRQQEYYIAQKKYADYVDANDNIILQSGRTEQERLQNDMNLTYQVYSQVANQLQVARAKVQEEKPVFAVVEPAVVPISPSGMGLKKYALLFIFLAVISTISWVLIGRIFWNSLKDEMKKKLDNDLPCKL